MGNSQPPNLSKALVAGGVLAVAGIGLFLLLYFGLGIVDAMPRLLVSLCVPPLVIGVLIGGYVLATGKLDPTNNKNTPE